jgi:hypothetical protein
MPSRVLILVIVIFWLATTGWFVSREVAPRWRSGDAPPYVIELADEALRNAPKTRWRLLRNGKDVGQVLTSMQYVDAGNAFDLKADAERIELGHIGPISVTARKLTNVLRVNRDGELRGLQTRVELEVLGAVVRVDVAAEVKAGMIHRSCKLTSPAGEINPTLEPVAYRRGSVLNTMHPVNRVTGIRPGQQWRVPLFDPLSDALKSAVPTGSPEAAVQFLNAEVLAQPQELEWEKAMQPCFVITYSGGDDFSGRTWVRVADGLVLRQEAQAHGDTLVLLRE